MGRHRLVAGTTLLLLAACGRTAQPPRELPCGVCTQAPRLDGEVAPGEWDAAETVSWELSLVRLDGEPAGPARPVQLWAMSSAANLYLAYKVPDASREMTWNPPLADLMVLAFCRGEALAAGDDRKVLLPGVYADKHVLQPGRDADDARKDGAGILRWHSEQGGFYVLELQVPLDTGDGEDIAAKPGDRLKFNLVYADKFQPGAKGMEVGGLFGASADEASGWGVLQLADTTVTEEPAPVPEWLTAAFPHTGEPDHLEHRLRRIDASEIDVDGRLGGAVTVELSYPRLDGVAETAQARLWLPPALRDDPRAKLPLLHSAGYELDELSALGLLREGYVVATPHGHPLNPLSRGPHLDNALLHALRGLPFVDGRRIVVQGGSAGGWTTLMVAASAFPLAADLPAVPPVDLGYNLAYIASQGTTGPPPADGTQSKTPVLAAVHAIVGQLVHYFNLPFGSDVYRALSPAAQVETITAPTQVYFSTADMLVPLDQVASDLVQPHDAAVFPAGFTTGPAACLPGRATKTLCEALSAEAYERFVPELPEQRVAMKPDATPEPGTPPAVAMPFSRTKAWSIVVLDEGPVEPHVGHFKYHWNLDTATFRRWAVERGAQPEQLTAAKLKRLMWRLQGKPWLGGEVKPEGAAAPRPGTYLDWPEAEREDVLRGLRAFAADDACAVQLGQVYARLAAEDKALGPALGDGSADGVREAL